MLKYYVSRGSDSVRLPEDVKFILDTLHKNGLEGYVVGGCVRDTLLGKEPKDWDVCTNAKPEKVMSVFDGFNIIPTGLQHGTVTVVINHIGYEITTYRVDGDYSDGRHPDSVSFTSSLAEDLSRRDFTVNALAYNEVEGIVDIFGGIEDLRRKRIKCVGKAIDRFNEDALRILRALRFSSVLGFDIDIETKKAIFEVYKNLDKIAKERINAEFSKLILGVNNVKILREYEKIIFYIIPELSKLKGFEQNNPYHTYDVWMHSLRTLYEVNEKDLELRLAALFHDIAKPDCYSIDENGVGHFYEHPEKSAEITERIMKDLKFSNEEIDTVITLIKNHDNQLSPTKKCLRKILNKMEMPLLLRLLELKKADIKAQNPKYLDRLNDIENFENVIENFSVEEECFSLKHLKINGNDLISLGIKPGKQMGEILNNLLSLVVEEQLVNERNELLKYIKNNYLLS